MGKTNNTGLDLAREQAEQDGSEWTFGATSPDCLFTVPEVQRSFFLPVGELQNIGEEKSGCVSRAYINILETKFTYAYRNGLILEENKAWLEKNSYVQGDKVVFADANIEILSGTTRQGNSLKAPVDAIRKHGLVPKPLLPQLEKWDDHYNPDRITDRIKTLGLEFLKRFKINYEQVSLGTLESLLAKDCVALAGYAWPTPKNGVYPAQPGLPLNHCFVGFANPLTHIFDNYLDTDGDFIKRLAPDYVLWNYGYRVYVSAQNTPEHDEIQATVFQVLMKHGLLSFFAEFVRRFFSTPEPVKLPPNPPVTTKPKEDLIEKFAKGIEEFESGGNKNAASYRRNNPGNLKSTSGKFKEYATYEAGFADLCNYIVRACTNEHAAYVARAAQLKLKSSGDLTIKQFIEVYAPDPEPIPTNYAAHLAKKVGLLPTSKIKELL